METVDSKYITKPGNNNDKPYKIEPGRSFIAKNTKKDMVDKLREKYKKLDCNIEDGFLCNKCDKTVRRYSIWDKIAYPSGDDYALFRCSICKQVYIGEMNKETKDWVIGHIKTVDNLVDIVV